MGVRRFAPPPHFRYLLPAPRSGARPALGREAESGDFVLRL